MPKKNSTTPFNTSLFHPVLDREHSNAQIQNGVLLARQ